MKRVTAVSTVLLPAWVLGACAQEPARGAPPPSGAGTTAAAGQQTVGPDYIIGPGDSLQIFVWCNPELSQLVPVRPDGKISTPLVEDMVAVGKTPSQLARDIEVVPGEYIRSPQVNVIVSVPVSAFSQIKVIGQVSNPQSMAYREGMRVLDAVLAAGGLGMYASGDRAKIVRRVAGKETELRVKLDDLINKGDMKHNLELLPGDVLVVPQIVETLTERKVRMGDLADAFLSLPGGIGTLDELFEALSWAQLGLEQKPNGLLNVSGYYDSLIAFLDRADETGFLKPKHRELLISGSDVPGLLENPNRPDSVISHLKVDRVSALKRQGIVEKGMIPKVDSAVAAIKAGVEKVTFVDGRVPHAVLLDIFTDEGIGTEVVL